MPEGTPPGSAAVLADHFQAAYMAANCALRFWCPRWCFQAAYVAANVALFEVWYRVCFQAAYMAANR